MALDYLSPFRSDLLLKKTGQGMNIFRYCSSSSERQQSSFGSLLSSIRQERDSSSSNQTAGLTLEDYRKEPVRCRSGKRHDSGELNGIKKRGGEKTTVELQSKALQEIPVDSEKLPFDSVPSFSPETVQINSKTVISGATSTQDIIEEAVRKSSEKYEIPSSLIKAVIKAESDFQATAVSPAGAQGLMQLMPVTAGELGVTDPFDIHQNIDGGSRYLRQMMDRFDGDVKKALTAYNAGPGRVLKYGIDVPFEETRQYVKRVLEYSEKIT